MRWQDIIREGTPAGAVKPVKPLTPAAARRRAQRQNNIHQKIHTTQRMQALQLYDLRAKLDDV